MTRKPYPHPRYDSRPCVACHDAVGRGISLEHADFKFASLCGDCAARLGLIDKSDYYLVPPAEQPTEEIINAS